MINTPQSIGGLATGATPANTMGDRILSLIFYEIDRSAFAVLADIERRRTAGTNSPSGVFYSAMRDLASGDYIEARKKLRVVVETGESRLGAIADYHLREIDKNEAPRDPISS